MFRLPERVRVAVRAVVAAEPVQQGVRVLLRALQLRAAGHLRELPHVSLLCRHHHPRRAPKVPLTPPRRPPAGDEQEQERQPTPLHCVRRVSDEQ